MKHSFLLFVIMFHFITGDIDGTSRVLKTRRFALKRLRNGCCITPHGTVLPCSYQWQRQLRGGGDGNDSTNCDGWNEDDVASLATAATAEDMATDRAQSHSATAPADNTALHGVQDNIDAPCIGHDAIAAIAELSIPRMFHAAMPGAGDCRDILVPDDMPLAKAVRAAGAARRVLLRRGATLAADRVLHVQEGPSSSSKVRERSLREQ